MPTHSPPMPPPASPAHLNNGIYTKAIKTAVGEFDDVGYNVYGEAAGVPLFHQGLT
jgi:hypothetical protein